MDNPWISVKMLFWRWKHRRDTPEQRAVHVKKAMQDVITAVGMVKESFKDTPADKELMDVFKGLNDMCDTLEDKS